MQEGRLDEAEAEIDKAHDLDPFSPVIACQAASVREIRRRFGEAISILDRLIQMEPAFKEAYRYRCFVHAQTGDREKAFKDLEDFRRFGGRDEIYDLARVELIAFFGDKEKAHLLAQELLAKPYASALEPAHKAELFAALGDVEEFFKWVEAALEVDPLMIASLRYDPVYDTVRKDARFAALFERMGFKA
jgi:tetratricopeptide (TPR) repeat protein